MTVSVVVVNWNAGAALDACLESVRADGLVGRELIVVDNASSDGSATRVRARHPEVMLLESGDNLGFARAANLGAQAARGDTLVFLNPDARVLPGAIATLVGALEASPGAGIAGGGLCDGAGRWQPGAARFGPVAHLILDTTLGRLPARCRRRPYRVDWVYGTFMAVRTAVFRRLGGFDARYFVYGEDLDLCYRAAAVGVRTIHVPEARAVHGGNLSAMQRFGDGRAAAVVQGELRFYATLGPGALRRFRTVATAKFALKALVAAVLGRAAAAAGYARVVQACLGAPGSP